MASVYEARWNKAKSMALDILKRQAEATKAFGKEAMLVDDGELVEGELIVDDWQVYVLTANPTCHCSVFENDPEWDHGSHTPVKKIEERFSKFEVFVPWQTT